jgi:ABC-type multidrug transport system fused ATPase/permease subunit
VNFRYPTRPEVEVCKNYSITIEPGQVVALVGPSGSGKVRLCTCLCHLCNDGHLPVLDRPATMMR